MCLNTWCPPGGTVGKVMEPGSTFLCFSCVLMKRDPATSCLAGQPHTQPHTPAALPPASQSCCPALVISFSPELLFASVFCHSSRKIVNKITLDVSPFEVQLWLLKSFSWPRSSFLQNKISEVSSCSFYTSKRPPQPSG